MYSAAVSNKPYASFEGSICSLSLAQSHIWLEVGAGAGEL